MARYIGRILIASIIITARMGYSDILLEGDNKDHALFIVPGAFKASESYRGIARALQQSFQSPPVVFIPKLTLGFPQKSEIDAKIEEFIELSQNKNQKLTIIGHSQGGLTASAVNNPAVVNIVLLASYLRKDYFRTTPLLKPRLLSIGGLDDKVVRPERIAFDALRNKGKKNNVFVLMNDVGHFDFADGKNQLGQGKVTRDIESIHLDIAEIIEAFISDASGAKMGRLTRFLESESIISGYLDNLSLDQNLCEESQRQHIGDDGSIGIVYNQINYRRKIDYPRFILDKSKLNPGPVYSVRIPAYYEYRPNIIDIAPLQGVYPEVVACKMRSSEAVSDRLGVSLENRSCGELNLNVMRQAANGLPEVRREILTNKGLDLTFDVIDSSTVNDRRTITTNGLELVETLKDRGEQWALSVDFKVKTDSEKIRIETSSVTTDVGDPNNTFLGAFYCKIVSYSRAYTILERMSR